MRYHIIIVVGNVRKYCSSTCLHSLREQGCICTKRISSDFEVSGDKETEQGENNTGTDLSQEKSHSLSSSTQVETETYAENNNNNGIHPNARKFEEIIQIDYIPHLYSVVENRSFRVHKKENKSRHHSFSGQIERYDSVENHAPVDFIQDLKCPCNYDGRTKVQEDSNLVMALTVPEGSDVGRTITQENSNLTVKMPEGNSVLQRSKAENSFNNNTQICEGLGVFYDTKTTKDKNEYFQENGNQNSILESHCTSALERFESVNLEKHDHDNAAHLGQLLLQKRFEDIVIYNRRPDKLNSLHIPNNIRQAGNYTKFKARASQNDNVNIEQLNHVLEITDIDKDMELAQNDLCRECHQAKIQIDPRNERLHSFSHSATRGLPSQQKTTLVQHARFIKAILDSALSEDFGHKPEINLDEYVEPIIAENIDKIKIKGSEHLTQELARIDMKTSLGFERNCPTTSIPTKLSHSAKEVAHSKCKKIPREKRSAKTKRKGRKGKSREAHDIAAKSVCNKNANNENEIRCSSEISFHENAASEIPLKPKNDDFQGKRPASQQSNIVLQKSAVSSRLEGEALDMSEVDVGGSSASDDRKISYSTTTSTIPTSTTVVTSGMMLLILPRYLYLLG